MFLRSRKVHHDTLEVCLLLVHTLILVDFTNLWHSVSHKIHVVPNHQILVKGLWAHNSFIINQPYTTHLLKEQKYTDWVSCFLLYIILSLLLQSSESIKGCCLQFVFSHLFRLLLNGSQNIQNLIFYLICFTYIHSKNKFANQGRTGYQKKITIFLTISASSCWAFCLY